MKMLGDGMFPFHSKWNPFLDLGSERLTLTGFEWWAQKIALSIKPWIGAEHIQSIARPKSSMAPTVR